MKFSNSQNYRSSWLHNHNFVRFIEAKDILEIFSTLWSESKLEGREKIFSASATDRITTFYWVCFIVIECSICNKRFPNPWEIKHLRTHSARKLFDCNLCEYSTKIKKSQEAHGTRYRRLKISRNFRAAALRGRKIILLKRPWNLFSSRATIKCVAIIISRQGCWRWRN